MTFLVPQPAHAADANGDAEADGRLVERVFEATIGALELVAVYLGDRLGLYRGAGRRGPATSAELAERTGTDERYAREWLEQQAVERRPRRRGRRRRRRAPLRAAGRARRGAARPRRARLRRPARPAGGRRRRAARPR